MRPWLGAVDLAFPFVLSLYVLGFVRAAQKGRDCRLQKCLSLIWAAVKELKFKFIVRNPYYLLLYPYSGNFF